MGVARRGCRDRPGPTRLGTSRVINAFRSKHSGSALEWSSAVARKAPSGSARAEGLGPAIEKDFGQRRSGGLMPPLRAALVDREGTVRHHELIVCQGPLYSAERVGVHEV